MGVRTTIPPALEDAHSEVLAGVASRVKAIREALGLRQEDLAEAADLRLSHVSRVEAGDVTLSLQALADLANGLGQSLHTLFGLVCCGRLDLEGLPRQLTRHREARSWSFERLSERSGASVAHLRGVEAGKGGLSLTSMVSIALALDINPADLLEARLA